MKILASNDVILDTINKYPNHNWIRLEIREMSEYEIQIVITVNKKETCHLADDAVIHVCSAQINNENDIVELKKYGKLITRLIRKKFPNRNVFWPRIKDGSRKKYE